MIQLHYHYHQEDYNISIHKLERYNYTVIIIKDIIMFLFLIRTIQLHYYHQIHYNVSVDNLEQYIYTVIIIKDIIMSAFIIWNNRNSVIIIMHYYNINKSRIQLH